MNFDFNQDQQEIKRTARDLLTARFPAGRVRELAEAGETDDRAWEELSGLGWPGIFVSDAHGGQGLGVVELVVLAEELGYALAPTPFLSNAAAGLILAHAGSEEQQAKWLPGVASGEQRGTAGFARDGRALLVPDAEGAAFAVLVEGDSAWLYEAPSVEPVETLDMTRRFGTIQCDGGEELPGDVAAGVDRVLVALAAESVGVAARAMEMAVEYAKDRKQFGHPIGVHQAVQHRCAQMYLEVESARSATYFAAWAADHEPETLPLAAAAAKAYAGDIGWSVTSSSLQVHGGIGFTWEHDLQFFLKRAAVNARLFGSAREHRERVADLIGL